MVAITDVTLTAGVPTAGTGTVTTLDKFNGAVGTPTTQAMTVQGNASGTAIPVSLASAPSTPVTNVTASNLNAAVVGTGTAGSPAGNVLTVQGVGSMTPLFIASGTGPASTMNSATASAGVSSALAAVFDDVAPTAITENNFGAVRMSGNRNLYGTIRDAAGNERGTNVTANNELNVTDPTQTAQGTALGTTKTALAGGSVTTASPTYTTGQINPLSLDTTGALRVNVTAGGAGGGIVTQATGTNLHTVVDAGSAIIGKVGIDQTTDGTTNKVRAIVHDGTTAALIKAASSGAAAASDPALVVTLRDVNANGRAAAASSAPVALSTEDNALLARLLPTATASGVTASRVNAAASTNATSLKASAGQVYTIDVFNAAAYNVFLKLYNKASAPTVGTDTPVMTIPIQAGGGYSKTWPTGLPFSTGIAYAITKLQADSDTTVVVAGDLTGNTTWI